MRLMPPQHKAVLVKGTSGSQWCIVIGGVLVTPALDISRVPVKHAGHWFYSPDGDSTPGHQGGSGFGGLIGPHPGHWDGSGPGAACQ